MFSYKRAICYSGYRENQSPITKVYPTYDEVLEDLKILEKEYDYIRMYDPYNHARTVLEVIRNENINLKVMLGMDLAAEYSNANCPWLKQNLSIEEINRNIEHNNESLRLLIELANKYEDEIIFLAAGNEARPSWGDNLVTNERIVYFINELKKNCKQPVSYCEGWDLWVGQIDPILDAVDFLSIHIYPMWNKVSIKDAVNYTIEKFEEVQNYTNKPCIITEMGWATSSNNNEMIIEEANASNQKIYIEEFNKYLIKNNKLGFYFEAFDEPWKGGNNPIEAEKNWGLYYVNRTKK